MIASEKLHFDGSDCKPKEVVLTNKYAEGYPGKTLLRWLCECGHR
jgi:glycine/serine hydroxymethyltransferase